MVILDHAPRIGPTTSRTCAHCALPLPHCPHRETSGGESLLFCCVGCVLVYRVVGSTNDGGRADWFLAKLGLAAILSGNVMMFQSLSYFGTLAALGTEVVNTASWIMFCCSLAVFALLGVPMLRVAIRGLAGGRVTLETLIGFGALAAIGYSAAQTLRGAHELYYDSGTMVLVFVALGQYLDAESRRRALTLLLPTLGKARRLARLFRDGVEFEVAPASVQPGDIVYVRAGEEIPVDGTVWAGRSDVHEPLLTGEWRPRLVVEGDPVSAGSMAVDGALRVQASGQAETIADKLQRFASEARDRRAPVEAAADKVIAWFIPAVLAIAAASVCAWTAAGEWERGLQAALAVLVVACPCALGIATPMATTVALVIATGRGCLVRSGAALEALSRVRTMAFDKTGTLTVGKPRVLACQACEGAVLPPEESLRLAAGVELDVSHPYARAIVDAVRARGIEVPAARAVSVTAGGGACGEVEGYRLIVGKLSWLTSRGVATTEKHGDDSSTVVGIAVDGCLSAQVMLTDSLRPEADEALLALRRMGVTLHLLSGDRQETVAYLARNLGFADFTGDLSPLDKTRRVRALRRHQGGLVAMVGDGVNDAPALGAAEAGIAFGPAADLTKSTADITILRNDLGELPRLLSLARKTFRIVRQNLAWAFAYNAVAVIIAAFGLLRPVYAAAAMVLSSACVVNNSMRLGRSPHGAELPAVRTMQEDS